MFSRRHKALEYVELAYRNTAVRSLTTSPESFLAIKGNGPKKLRKAQRADLEAWRFARGSHKAYVNGGTEKMHEYQRNFRWRFNK